MKRILLIFCAAFALNAAWENLHAFLYDNYMGGPITQYILLRAALVDAVMIVSMTLPFVLIPKFRKYVWSTIIIGIIIAISLEWYALSTGRWAYNTYMPIIPFLEVGLTPTLQLGLLAYLSFSIQNSLMPHKKQGSP